MSQECMNYNYNYNYNMSELNKIKALILINSQWMLASSLHIN